MFLVFQKLAIPSLAFVISWDRWDNLLLVIEIAGTIQLFIRIGLLNPEAPLY
jgi:hypothetical protein